MSESLCLPDCFMPASTDAFSRVALTDQYQVLQGGRASLVPPLEEVTKDPGITTSYPTSIFLKFEYYFLLLLECVCVVFDTCHQQTTL